MAILVPHICSWAFLSYLDAKLRKPTNIIPIPLNIIRRHSQGFRVQDTHSSKLESERSVCYRNTYYPDTAISPTTRTIWTKKSNPTSKHQLHDYLREKAWYHGPRIWVQLGFLWEGGHCACFVFSSILGAARRG